MGRRITLRADELAGFRAAVIACSPADDREPCERLLGQIASLESQASMASPDSELTFAPPAGTEALARRALENLRAKPLARRFKREPASSTERRRARL